VLLYVPLLTCLGLLVVQMLGGSPVVAIAAGAAGGAAPLFVVRRMRNKRLTKFAEQLPDALDLIRAALQAGHALSSALNVVANEFPDPIAEEFREVAEEVRLGLPLRDALNHLADRMEDENLPILTVGILVTQEVGGNLAEVLDNISYTIRERFKLLRETRVLTAQGRLSGYLLSFLPFGVGVGIWLMNPKYFAPMVETPAGRGMMVYCAISILLGHIVMSRIVKIKV
jgi:tight adherence protein B